MRHLRAIVVAVAVLLGTVAATIAVPAGPAAAAGSGVCGTATGISVVVDFHGIGGTDEFCDTSGATSAKALFEANESVTYSSSYPGSVVCRIAGLPSDASCHGMPPQSAYWALYWSDGKDGAWHYSSQGIASLDVPQGGYVAFSWSQGGDTPPGVPATAHAAAAPSRTASPKPTRTSGPTGGKHRGGGPPAATTSAAPASQPAAAAPPSSATASGSPTRRVRHHRAGHAATVSARPAPTPTRSAGPSASPSPGVATTTSEPAASSGGGLPGWVPPVVVGALVVIAGAVTLLRRRRT